MNSIDKTIGYYSKKFKLLSNIIKEHSSWFNKCTEEQNFKAKEAIKVFYSEYKKCKPDNKYCAKMEMGHFSYLVYLLPLRQALMDELYQRACNELYSLLYYDYFLQKRIIDNFLFLLEGYLELESE